MSLHPVLEAIPITINIKLRSVGYRLVYEVEDDAITVYVINVGRRDTIYKMLKKRKR